MRSTIKTLKPLSNKKMLLNYKISIRIPWKRNLTRKKIQMKEKNKNLPICKTFKRMQNY